MTNSGGGNRNKYKNMKLDGYEDPMGPIIIDNNSSVMRKPSPKKSPNSRQQTRQSNKMQNQQENSKGRNEIPNNSNAYSTEMENTLDNRSFAKSMDRNRASNGQNRFIQNSTDKKNSKQSGFKKDLNESNDEGSLLTKGYGFDKKKNTNRNRSPTNNSKNNLSSKNNTRSSGEQRFTNTQGSVGKMSINSSKSKENNLRNQNVRQSEDRKSAKQLIDMDKSKRASANSRNSNRQLSSNGKGGRIGSQKSNGSTGGKNTQGKSNESNVEELKSDITPGSTMIKSQQVSNNGSNEHLKSKEKLSKHNKTEKDDSN